MKNTLLITTFLAAAILPTLGTAAETQTLGVREGIAEQVSPSKMQDRFKGFADYIGNATGRQTLVDASQDSKFMLQNMKSGKYDILFVRPSGLAGRAIRENGYVLVAEAKDELYAAFIVKKDSPVRTVKDLAGKRVAMPEQSAFITKVALASLKDAGVDHATLNIQYTRYQDSAAFSVDQSVADVAVVSPIVSKPWEKKGGRLIHRSKRVPSWAVVASSKVSAAEVAKLRAALLNMDNSENGRKVLSQIGVSGFMEGKPADYVSLLDWIGV